MLGDAGLLDIAHAAEDLDGGRRDLDAEVGAPALADRDEQIDTLLCRSPLVLVGIVVGDVDALRGAVDDRAHRLELGLHRQQHATHVGVVDDRRLLAGLGADGSALQPLLRVLASVLVGAISDGEALETDREAGVVHHREHVGHAPVLLADEEAGGFVVVEDAGGRRLDAELVLDRLADHAVAVAEAAVVVHQELGHDEHRDALGAGRRVGRAGQHEVDDVVGHVVLAPRDPDLRARDLVGAVVLLLGSGAHGTDVGAGLGLGQVHGPGPLASDHLGEIRLLLDLVTVGEDGVDRPLRQQRSHRERLVRRGEHLLHGDADEPGEAAAAVGLGHGDATPAGFDVVAVGLDEAVGRRDGVVLMPHRRLLVAHTVEGRDLVLHEPGALAEHAIDHVDLGVPEALVRRETLEPGDVLQHEADVVGRDGVVGHPPRLPAGRD